MPFKIGQSQVRQPRGIVNLNGTPIKGWMHFSATNNSFSAADTFSVSFAVNSLPTSRNAVWFSEQTDMYVECFAGFPADPDSYAASDLQSLIYGQADDIHYDPEQGTIEVSGRDLTRVFIDTKTTQKWPNLTASQIVTQLASSHGLTPAVTATTEQVGRFYETDHVELSDERSEWDLICYFARLLNFRAYVRGKTLYFNPAPDQSTTAPYVLTWQNDAAGGAPSSNMMRPVFSRNLGVSRGIQVVIRSWNGKQKKAFNAAYPNSKVTAIKPGQSGSQTQVYRYTYAGLTQEAATARAKTIYDQLVQHEMQLEYQSPADNELDITNVLEVQGTGTKYDQRYFPDSIDRTLDIEGGYVMRVHAKNHSPESDATA